MSTRPDPARPTFRPFMIFYATLIRPVSDTSMGSYLEARVATVRSPLSLKLKRLGATQCPVMGRSCREAPPRIARAIK